jgi:hypothetical protein
MHVFCTKPPHKPGFRCLATYCVDRKQLPPQSEMTSLKRNRTAMADEVSYCLSCVYYSKDIEFTCGRMPTKVLAPLTRELKATNIKQGATEVYVWNKDWTAATNPWSLDTSRMCTKRRYKPSTVQGKLLALCQKWFKQLLPSKRYTNPEMVSARYLCQKRPAHDGVDMHIDLPSVGPAILVIPFLKAGQHYILNIGCNSTPKQISEGSYYILEKESRWVIAHRVKWPSGLTERSVLLIGFTADAIDVPIEHDRPAFARTIGTLHRRFPALVHMPPSGKTYPT